MIIEEAYSSGFGLVFIKDDLYSGPVIPVTILSNNKGPSTGIVFAHEGYFVYIPNFAPDIKQSISQLKQSVTLFNTTLTTIATSIASITTTAIPIPDTPNVTLAINPPTIQADVISLITNIDLVIRQINTLKSLLI